MHEQRGARIRCCWLAYLKQACPAWSQRSPPRTSWPITCHATAISPLCSLCCRVMAANTIKLRGARVLPARSVAPMPPSRGEERRRRESLSLLREATTFISLRLVAPLLAQKLHPWLPECATMPRCKAMASPRSTEAADGSIPRIFAGIGGRGGTRANVGREREKMNALVPCPLVPAHCKDQAHHGPPGDHDGTILSVAAGLHLLPLPRRRPRGLAAKQANRAVARLNETDDATQKKQKSQKKHEKKTLPTCAVQSAIAALSPSCEGGHDWHACKRLTNKHRAHDAWWRVVTACLLQSFAAACPGDPYLV